ncbi:MAG: hypothetical protein ACFE9S_08870 [Candidatus Hermodarchaeota archaeon]
MQIENIEDYTLSVNNYRNGNYFYETITSTEDIRNAIERGKKFVFLGAGAAISIIVGSVIFSIALILSMIFYYYMYVSIFFDLILFSVILIFFGIFAIPSLRILIQGILTLRKPFLVLGQEGIVYKLKTGDVKGYNWEDISMDVVEKREKFSDQEGYYSISFEISISMPNGDFLNFNRGDYTMKEFPDKEKIGRKQVNYLFLQTFLSYYNYGKKGIFS